MVFGRFVDEAFFSIQASISPYKTAPICSGTPAFDLCGFRLVSELRPSSE
jgi:hypothetical protein